jgi:hypothetical protein
VDLQCQNGFVHRNSEARGATSAAENGKYRAADYIRSVAALYDKEFLQPPWVRNFLVVYKRHGVC